MSNRQTPISYVSQHLTDDLECFTLDEICPTSAELVMGDGFCAVLRNVRNSISVRCYLAVGHGLYEPMKVTDAIRKMVEDYVGTSAVSRVASIEAVKSKRRKEKSEKLMAEIASTATPKPKAPKAKKDSKEEVKTAPEAVQAPKEDTKVTKPTQSNTSMTAITDLLSQCSTVIEELTGHITDAQVAGEPLAFYCNGSQYRASKARTQLVESGLVERTDEGYVLTQKGMDAKIATYMFSSSSKKKVLRYMPEVAKYFDLKDPQGKILKTVGAFVLIDPKGKEWVVESPTAFAREHGLDKGKLYLLRKGMMKSSKGWTYSHDIK